MYNMKMVKILEIFMLQLQFYKLIKICYISPNTIFYESRKIIYNTDQKSFIAFICIIFADTEIGIYNPD